MSSRDMTRFIRRSFWSLSLRQCRGRTDGARTSSDRGNFPRPGPPVLALAASALFSRPCAMTFHRAFASPQPTAASTSGRCAIIPHAPFSGELPTGGAELTVISRDQGDAGHAPDFRPRSGLVALIPAHDCRESVRWTEWSGYVDKTLMKSPRGVIDHRDYFLYNPDVPQIVSVFSACLWTGSRRTAWSRLSSSSGPGIPCIARSASPRMAR